jgi:hypothetical protein
MTEDEFNNLEVGDQFRIDRIRTNGSSKHNLYYIDEVLSAWISPSHTHVIQSKTMETNDRDYYAHAEELTYEEYLTEDCCQVLSTKPEKPLAPATGKLRFL